LPECEVDIATEIVLRNIYKTSSCNLYHGVKCYCDIYLNTQHLSSLIRLSKREYPSSFLILGSGFSKLRDNLKQNRTECDEQEQTIIQIVRVTFSFIYAEFLKHYLIYNAMPTTYNTKTLFGTLINPVQEIGIILYHQKKIRGQKGSLWTGYVMSTKVILIRAEVFVLAELCLPRSPHALLPRSHVLREKRKRRRT